ncbi:hypothetical protein [Dechloromonas sp. A34]|uniref:hypothetical protein n=1 Tax=Dechloromonas sp. A34 TaxID=447588 RepID=UPI002248F0E3|nr:hypothetical protein [Dechloromonas sp. A34]
MKQRPNDPQQKSGQLPSSLSEAVTKQKQRAEQREVSGRHKNDGSKARKGGR